MLEYETRPYRVILNDDGDLISCNCGYFQHVGMLCRHSIKVLVRKDIFKIPAKNILTKWTRQAKEGLVQIDDNMHDAKAMHDSAARQNILYIAAVDAVKEICHCEDMLEKTLQVFRVLKIEAVSKRNQDARLVLTENHSTPPKGL